MTDNALIEELDLSIPDMDSDHAESQVSAILKDIPGLVHVRLIERGALIRYRPGAIDHEKICSLLRQGGFRASVFQDSTTGDTGVSSQ